jgi:hypothetical protein
MCFYPDSDLQLGFKLTTRTVKRGYRASVHMPVASFY